MKKRNSFEENVRAIEIIEKLGYGTFGRVKLCKIEGEYFAIKIMKKVEIIRQDQIEHVRSEREVLQLCKHPFIVSFKASFQDEYNIYMLYEYICGGELFTRLSKDGRFSNDVTLFYISEVVSAILYLHQKGIVYRDLKPENLMISQDGHLKIIDMGFAKQLRGGRTYTMCGTPEYIAPEVLSDRKGEVGYGTSVDYWGIGILIYELLAGRPPFFARDDPSAIYDKILKGVIYFPDFFSLRAKDIIIKLLNPDPRARFGVKTNGQEITRHKWFRRVDWADVDKKRVPVPWQPKPKYKEDLYCFEKIPSSRQSLELIRPELQVLFKDF
jgi:serine/threonine protein kinase